VRGKDGDGVVGGKEGMDAEKGKGKQEEGEGEKAKAKRGKRKNPRGSGQPVNPSELARSLEALLPKRPVRGRDKPVAKVGRGRKGRAVVVESGESDGGVGGGRKRGKGKGKTGVGARVKGKAKVGGKEGGEEIDLDGDEREVRLVSISESFLPGVQRFLSVWFTYVFTDGDADLIDR
jgi:hypothetical protein